MPKDDVVSFNIAVDKFLEQSLDADVNQFKRSYALHLLTGIVFKTPVKTGRARSNWQVAINKPNTVAIEVSKKETAQTVINRGDRTIGKVELGDNIYITNNLPYILKLENGGSMQNNRRSMVALTIEEINSVFPSG